MESGTALSSLGSMNVLTSKQEASGLVPEVVHFRKWRLLGLTTLFIAINPVLFSEPTEELDDWMYKVVRAEQRWTNDGNPFLGLDYPQILNTLSVPAMLYGLYAAYKRKPLQTVVFTIASQGLNQWWMKEIIDHYEAIDSEQ